MIIKNKGFTLIELLVVISIISLLSSVVFAGLTSARERARNVVRLSDVAQYSKALEIYQLEKGGYFHPNNTAWQCLGEGYSNGNCWASNYSEESLVPELKPYFEGMPAGTSVNKSVGSDIEGYIYRCALPPSRSSGNPSSCTRAVILYTLEGVNQDCGIGHITNPNWFGITACRIIKDL